jgi:hypothetical protein
MRISEEAFRQLPLRVHAFLADVPVHDVWALHLHGNVEGGTLRELQARFMHDNMQRVNPIVKSLFWLRGRLGNLFGWDEAMPQALTSSYLHRLTEADRAQSLDPPGSASGPFRVLYAFDNEVLCEVINRTVHAFSLMAMTPAPHGHTVYWAIYVKKVSWLTPLYMTLIDPFRRFLVYPMLIRSMERTWATTSRAMEAG